MMRRDRRWLVLGAKVVRPQEDEREDGAEQCRYKTNKTQKQFAKTKARVQLEVTVQVLTDQLRAEIVVAIKGNVAVQAALQNFQSSTGRLRRVSEAAVRAALPRLDRVSVNPPRTSSS